MEKYLIWNKGLFDSNYQIYGDGKIQGSLQFISLKNDATGVALSKNIYFKSEGFSNPITKLINDKNEVIGLITYHAWQTKATLAMQSGEKFAFSFTNGWLSKWMISDFKTKQITYQSNTSAGNIFANTDDEIMLLAGLFIKEYYTRILILVLIFIVIIPIISSRF